MNISEFEDAYEDKERIRGAIFTTPMSQIMLRDPFVVDVAASVADAIKAMNDNHTGCVLVERDGKLAGVFTERDVLTKIAGQPERMTAKVESQMTVNPETIESTEVIAFALNKMSVGGYRHIPIVDNGGKAVGIVSVRDLVNFLVELFPQALLNVPPSTDKSIVKTLDGG